MIRGVPDTLVRCCLRNAERQLGRRLWSGSDRRWRRCRLFRAVMGFAWLHKRTVHRTRSRLIVHIQEPRRRVMRHYGACSSVVRARRAWQHAAASGSSPAGASPTADADADPDRRVLRQRGMTVIPTPNEARRRDLGGGAADDAIPRPDLLALPLLGMAALTSNPYQGPVSVRSAGPGNCRATRMRWRRENQRRVVPTRKRLYCAARFGRQESEGSGR